MLVTKPPLFDCALFKKGIWVQDFTIQAIRFRDCNLKVRFPCAGNKVARNCGAKSVGEWNTKNLVLSNEFIKVELTSWKIWKADFSSVSSSWNFHDLLSQRCTTVSSETRILYNISIYTLLIYLHTEIMHILPMYILCTELYIEIYTQTGSHNN